MDKRVLSINIGRRVEKTWNGPKTIYCIGVSDTHGHHNRFGSEYGKNITAEQLLNLYLDFSEKILQSEPDILFIVRNTVEKMKKEFI